MVVWNKAYRREFVEREGLAFPPGSYEDTPWTYPGAAGRRVGSRPWTGSASTTAGARQRQHPPLSSRRHFDIFEQYDRVFAFVDARPD